MNHKHAWLFTIMHPCFVAMTALSICVFCATALTSSHGISQTMLIIIIVASSVVVLIIFLIVLIILKKRSRSSSTDRATRRKIVLSDMSGDSEVAG